MIFSEDILKVLRWFSSNFDWKTFYLERKLARAISKRCGHAHAQGFQKSGDCARANQCERGAQRALSLSMPFYILLGPALDFSTKYSKTGTNTQQLAACLGLEAGGLGLGPTSHTSFVRSRSSPRMRSRSQISKFLRLSSKNKNNKTDTWQLFILRAVLRWKSLSFPLFVSFLPFF
jgi:hypothetical protein